MHELLERPWLAWIVISALFGIAEIVVPYFACLFAALAAIVAALAAAFSESVEIQLAIFAFSLIVGLVLLRPRVVQMLQSKKGVPSRTDALIGKVGVLIEAIDPVAGTGRVEVCSQDWAARSATPLPLSTRVKVESADGIVLIVSRNKEE